MKNNLENPLAIKFIRFYPVAYHNNKALRVEVYGSKQGKFSFFCENNSNCQGTPFLINYSLLYSIFGFHYFKSIDRLKRQEDY